MNKIFTGTLDVNYDRSVEEMVKVGCYIWAHEHISSINFPSKENGSRRINFSVFNFDYRTSPKEVIPLMEGVGFRQATLKELLAYGEASLSTGKTFPVAELGDKSLMYGCLMAVYVYCAHPRRVYVSAFDYFWEKGSSFLGIER